MEEIKIAEVIAAQPVQLVLVFNGPIPIELQPMFASLSSSFGISNRSPLPGTPSAEPGREQQAEEDSWLGIDEAAKYIGAARSTMYKYASQRAIESRKLCGRLQFRRSCLDEFKGQRVRPARQSLPTRRRIPAALGSGK